MDKRMSRGRDDDFDRDIEFPEKSNVLEKNDAVDREKECPEKAQEIQKEIEKDPSGEKKISDPETRKIIDRVEKQKDIIEKKHNEEKPIRTLGKTKKNFSRERNFQGYRKKKKKSEGLTETEKKVFQEKNDVLENRNRVLNQQKVDSAKKEKQDKADKAEIQKKLDALLLPPPSIPRVADLDNRKEEREQEVKQRAEVLCQSFSDLTQIERDTLRNALREGLREERQIDPFAKHREDKGRSENTLKQYQKSLSRIPRGGQGQMLLWYIDIQQHQKRSQSWLKLTKASLLYLCEKKEGYKRLSEALRGLPAIHQRLSQVNRDRKKKKDLPKLEKAISSMKRRADQHAIKAVLATGARVSEISSIKLFFREGERAGVGVKLRDVKNHDIRDFFVKKESWAYRALAEAHQDLGEDLFKNLEGKKVTKAFTDRWYRKCLRKGLKSEEYSCHALRHAHAAELKALYPKKEDAWRISERMGHTLKGKTTERYGNGENALGLL